MGQEILAFGDTEIGKNKFYHHIIAIFMGDVNIKKALASNKIPFGEKNYKYFIVTCIMVIKLNDYI